MSKSVIGAIPPPVYSDPVIGTGSAAGANTTAPVQQQPPQPPPQIQPQPPPEPVPDPEPEKASLLLRRLDAILVNIAETAVRSVDEKEVAAAIADVKLTDDDEVLLKAAAFKAKATFDILSRIPAKDIAAAMTVNAETGEVSWKKDDETANLVRGAIDAQADLSDRLRRIANSRDVDGGTFDTFAEMSARCDRRQSEIVTIAGQLAQAVAEGRAAAEGGGSAVDKGMDDVVGKILPRKAFEMHGTRDVLDGFCKRLGTLAATLDIFAKSPNSAISQSEFLRCQLELFDASEELKTIAKDGIDAGNGGRIMPDRTFFESASKHLADLQNKMNDVRKVVGPVYLENFIEKHLGIPEKFHVLDQGKLFAPKYPALALLASKRRELAKLALQYMKNPLKPTRKRMLDVCWDIYRDCTKAKLKEEIAELRKNEARQMSDADWNEFEDEFGSAGATYTQEARFKVMVDRVHDELSAEQFLTTTTTLSLLEGKVGLASLVEARIHGMSDDDVDPMFDDSRFVESMPLGSGKANRVHLLTYEGGVKCVFKPEGIGRQGIASLNLAKDYRNDQQVADLNLATQTAADYLGLKDIVAKTSVGMHDGQYGIFMSVAPGTTCSGFAKGKVGGERLKPADIKNLPAEQYRLVVGRLMHELNRLQWLDIVTGQGDRHSGNYMVAVGGDLSVTVTAIDNDMCYPGYRIGMATYRLDERGVKEFRKQCENIVKQYPEAHREAARKRLLEDPGVMLYSEEKKSGDANAPVEKVEKGVIDLSKIKAQELHLAAQKTIGHHVSALPEFIDRDLYDRLMSLKDKNGGARYFYTEDLEKRLPAKAVEAAQNRLDEAIAHAEKLMKEGRVYEKDDFAKLDVQKELLAHDLNVPANPIEKIGDEKTGEFQLADKLVVKEARYQVKSIFGHDLLPVLDRGEWK